ncbi:5403_t:CDS:2 [Cetraspora pellucida]|uniref:5403_t:CDS:1 n=1 Tax=Cetraspora pellucida TaxID=1433469 RepID=A0ACA9KNK7_9GLOM|nr:5403_t:CDS:2 [Cetraspora pellucida]
MDFMHTIDEEIENSIISELNLTFNTANNTYVLYCTLFVLVISFMLTNNEEMKDDIVSNPVLTTNNLNNPIEPDATSLYLGKFLVADKYTQDQEIIDNNVEALYLCFFNQQSSNFCKKRQTILEQKINYRKIHGIYKKALQMALQSKNKSQQLFDILQEFINERDNNEYSDLEESSHDTDDNKENSESVMFYLQNSKFYHSKGHLLDTKRFKLSHKTSNIKNTKNQHWCLKCGGVGHY